MHKKNTSRKNLFVGPLPPPVGGVAIANIRVQQIVTALYPEDEILIFNTTKGETQADLYKRKGYKEVKHFLSNIFNFIGFIFKNKSDIANVFIVPNISFIREAIFILILKLFSKKLVVHLHAKIKGDLFLEGWKLRLFTKIVGLGDVILVLSENYHKKFYANYINPDKLIVLENFVDYSKFDNNIKEKTSKFLYVGRLSEKKGFLTLVKAVAKAKDQLQGLTISVLGAFENEVFEKEVFKVIEEHALDQFVFYGPKMGEEKFQFFKESTVFIFPSYFENSPIVLKEAIAAKMAIIASDIEENKVILDPFDNKIYFKAKDETSLAKALVALYKNKDECHRKMMASQNILDYDITVAKKVLKETYAP